MMKTKLLPLLIFAVMLLGTAQPVSSAPPLDYLDTAVEIIVRINTYRQELGLPPYTYDPTLMRVAQKHTEYQASIGLSTHKGEGDSTSPERAAAGGYAGGEFAWVNEMIYTGQYATPEKAVEWWKDSPIHNEIMTSEEYHQIGVGVAESETHIFYTVNVGAIPDVTSPGDAGILGPDIGQVRTDMVPPDEAQLPKPTAEETLPVVEPDTPVEEEIQEVLPEEEPNVSGEAPAEENLAEEPVGQQGSAAESPNIDWIAVIGIGFAVLVAIGAVVTIARGQVSEGDIEALFDAEYNDFFSLPRDEQFNRLQLAARQALLAYPMEVVGVKPIRYGLSAEFLVQAYREGGGDVEQYVVRVNAPGFHTNEEIGSEMVWLAALNQDTELKVPNPLQTHSGEWLEVVHMDLLDGPRQCVVFEYVSGHRIEAEPTQRQLIFVGALIARLHAHGEKFVRPDNFSLRHWDLEGLKGGLLDVSAEKAYGALTPKELHVVLAAEKVVDAAMKRLGTGKLVYGLIHGDLDLKNVLFDGDDPMVLDFGTCGFGYYIYDLASAVWNLVERQDYAALRKALLDGYRQIRTLSIKEEKHLAHFIAGRLMAKILFWAARRDDPNLGEKADAAVKRYTRVLEQLIRRKAE